MPKRKDTIEIGFRDGTRMNLMVDNYQYTHSLCGDFYVFNVRSGFNTRVRISEIRYVARAV